MGCSQCSSCRWKVPHGSCLFYIPVGLDRCSNYLKKLYILIKPKEAKNG